MPLKRRTPTLNKPSGIVALIDGDIVQYTSACVCDVVSYHWEGHEPIHYKKDALIYGHAKGLSPDNIVKTITPEPVSFCKHTIKMMINNIIDRTDAGSIRVFLTGKGNYREDIDSRYPYKGHRSKEKPTHFAAAREYIIKRFGAEIVDGAEADDALGWNQTDDTIIATIDKDLDMIKGKHYNWNKDKLYEVTQDDADAFFYKQLLTGDNVDNIKGIKGVGKKTAEKFLAELSDNKSRFELCLQKYEEAGMDYYDLLENANLLWIQRSPNQHWSPPL